MRPATFTALACALASLLACAPELHDEPSLVSRARVLGVRLEPPDAKPGAVVSATALVASPDGAVTAPPIEWAFCAAPKSPAENRSVNPSCLAGAVLPAGNGGEPSFALPGDACALFGPETPPGDFRPRDPDRTGGYYQPVRLRLEGEDAFAFARVQCNLRSAPPDVAADFLRSYEPNRNPDFELAATLEDGTDAPLDRLPRDAKVRFEARWQPADAESYVFYDEAARALRRRRESISVAFYSTAGSFDVDRTGRAEDDERTTSGTAWHAPHEAGTVHGWVVVRDARGGLGFAGWTAVIEKPVE